MQLVASIDQVKQHIYSWRVNASLPWKICTALLMAGVVGLLAQVRIPLAFSPVPLTGQTFAVLLAGVFLGRRWGGISLIIYTILGLAGIPWFNGASSGLTGTAGYLIGFILSSFFIGYMTDRYPEFRNFQAMVVIMLFASLIMVYIPGVMWLGFWLHAVKGNAVSISSLLSAGVLPFISGDILKAIAAAATAKFVLPKESHTDNSVRLT